ncbi:unnamed protein product [Cyclocybe aegerita]|uniref:Actin-related protein 2 n=1 Tax=Cyclocybe aegerita TaxID=1973307 RepID=A0A8S0WCQ5_CYCAE|nr:unnamed protein product [Cyclocybe aegerita]
MGRWTIKRTQHTFSDPQNGPFLCAPTISPKFSLGIAIKKCFAPAFSPRSLLHAFLLFIVCRALNRLRRHNSLSRYPGPPLAALTTWYKAYYDIVKDGGWAEHLEALHQQYGKIVRVGPNELHFSDPQAYNDIYGMGTRHTKQSEMYSCFATDLSVFAMFDHHEVMQRRNLIGPFFSRRAILNLEKTVQNRIDLLVSRLLKFQDTKKSANLDLAFRSTSLDIITSYCFSKSSDFPNSDNFQNPILDAMDQTLPMIWIFKHFPLIKAVLLNMGSQIDDIMKDPSSLHNIEHETIYHHFLTPQPENQRLPPVTREWLLDEGLYLRFAGSDTVGNVCTVATYRILNDKRIHHKLLTALKEAWPDRDASPSFEGLEKIPYLTVVSMGSTILHKNPDVFPEPLVFKPERWMQDDSSELEKYLVSFSKGPRSCLGINLAWCELYLIIGTIFRRLELVPDNATMNTELPLVVDNGTGFVKVGYAGSNFPEHVFPSIVGRPILRAEERVGSAVIKDIMIGDEAAANRNYLQVTQPMEHGIVKNWEDMKHLWDYTFDEKLKINPQGRKVLLTEPPMNPRVNRERMCQVMFEEYGFQGVYVAIQAVLTLYAQGLTTGVVVDSGDGVTHIVPVYDGFAMPHLTRRLDIAGRDVTRYLIKLLLMRGYAFNRTADFETVREIKEKLCYVSYDLEQDKKLAEETTVLVESYTLPDGRVIKVGPERYEAPECMFQPHLVDVEQPGVAEMLFQTIQAAAVDIRSDLYKHIVLSGGSSMYPGLPSRLEKEIKQLHLTRLLNGDPTRLNKFKIKIEDPPRRKHMVFLGGAVLADIMKGREDFWVSREEWFEQGVRALDKLGRGDS